MKNVNAATCCLAEVVEMNGYGWDYERKDWVLCCDCAEELGRPCCCA